MSSLCRERCARIVASTISCATVGETASSRSRLSSRATTMSIPPAADQAGSRSCSLKASLTASSSELSSRRERSADCTASCRCCLIGIIIAAHVTKASNNVTAASANVATAVGSCATDCHNVPIPESRIMSDTMNVGLSERRLLNRRLQKSIASVALPLIRAPDITAHDRNTQVPAMAHNVRFGAAVTSCGGYPTGP